MKLVFATNNKHKLKEVQTLLPNTIELLSLDTIGCDEDIPETQLTIEGNALQKANYVKEHYGYDCFADDTGLEVNALNGAPGVYSARYAGPNRNAANNNSKLLKELSTKADRTARFKTVIALVLNGKTHTFEGICQGTITEMRKGEDGFGYDPLFQPEGFDKTFAEMTLEQKNELGHRGKAIQKLIQHLKTL